MRGRGRPSVIAEIREIVNRETRAWDARDVDLLLSVFHPDMVWPWPKSAESHDPMEWVLTQGRYDGGRWKKGWGDLFRRYSLVHNRRKIRKIMISREGDGAFAVVDIDTLWRDRRGKEMLWKGRTCKAYARVGGEWKMTMQTGALKYR